MEKQSDRTGPRQAGLGKRPPLPEGTKQSPPPSGRLRNPRPEGAEPRGTQGRTKDHRRPSYQHPVTESRQSYDGPSLRVLSRARPTPRPSEVPTDGASTPRPATSTPSTQSQSQLSMLSNDLAIREKPGPTCSATIRAAGDVAGPPLRRSGVRIPFKSCQHFYDAFAFLTTF